MVEKKGLKTAEMKINKYIFFMVFLGVTILLTNCKTIYIVPQESLTNSPCETSNKGVNVRIKNDGVFPFSKFILNVNGVDFPFEGLKSGEFSCYKNIPYIWTDNSFEIWHFYTEKAGRIVKTHPIDHIGERKIDNGYVTVSVVTNGSIRKPKETSIKIIVDEEIK